MGLKIPNEPEIAGLTSSEALNVDRVLYEAEIPVLYLTHAFGNQQMLAYLASEQEDGTYTLLSPVATRTLRDLESGLLSVRDALMTAGIWLHVNDGEVSRVWPIDIETIPDDYLPTPGTPLLPEHEPILRARAVGPEIVLGRMPASVVAFVAEATRKAIKILLDFALAQPSEGRPREEHRALYDLPIKTFAFASFELGFGAPEEGMFPDSAVKRATEKLLRGLTWASSDSREEFLAESDEEREAILRATLSMTPPSAGPIREMRVSGTWIASDQIILTRQSRKRVRSELRPVDSERIVIHQGRIGRVDRDDLTFILRDTKDNSEVSGYFAPELLEEMIDYLAEADLVEVAGFQRQGRMDVTAVAPLRSSTAV